MLWQKEKETNKNLSKNQENGNFDQNFKLKKLKLSNSRI